MLGGEAPSGSTRKKPCPRIPILPQKTGKLSVESVVIILDPFRLTRTGNRFRFLAPPITVIDQLMNNVK